MCSSFAHGLHFLPQRTQLVGQQLHEERYAIGAGV